MKTAFIRGLWGDMKEDTHGVTQRRLKVLSDIERVVNSHYPMDFVTYYFGEDNAPIFDRYNLKSVMIDRDSIKWDMKDELYRHKLEVIKRAMDDYDAIVYLDWDCILTKPLPDNIWDILGKGATLQANLFLYRTKKCLWRDVDLRKTCNGGFIYIADKKIPNHIIRNWEELSAWAKQQQEKRRARGLELRLREKSFMFDDEPSISKYVDDVCGGWPGVEAYWDRFEPKVCKLRKKSVFSEELNSSKDACFMHML